MTASGWTQDSTRVVSSKPAKSRSASDKVYYGGNIGFSFGSYSMIAIRPLVGYKVTPKLSAGLKLSYEYLWNSDYNTSNYGGSVFARYRFIPPLYAHVEYAALNYELYNILGQSTREWVPFLLVGAGYSQNIGGNTWVNAQVLFDVLQDEKSPYEDWSPFYSVGVGVGF